MVPTSLCGSSAVEGGVPLERAKAAKLVRLLGSIRVCPYGGKSIAHDRTDLNLSKLGRPNSEDSSFSDLEKGETL